MFKKIPDEEYFSLEALSNSGIRRINKSAADFKVETFRTPAMAFGNVVHCLTLEPGEFQNRYAVLPECDRRTTAGKAIYSDFLASAGEKEVITAGDYETAKKCTAAILGYTLIVKGTPVTFGDLLEGCERELACLWTHEFDLDGDIFSVDCKCKVDAVHQQSKLIFDIKTAADGSPDGFRRKMYDEKTGYYLQSAFYRLSPELKDYKFCFVVVEKVEPFCVGLYFPDDTTREHAMGIITRAAWLYKNGIETGEWSSQYNDQPEELIPPGWFWMTQK